LYKSLDAHERRALLFAMMVMAVAMTMMIVIMVVLTMMVVMPNVHHQAAGPR
jgi:hypothetical protein